LSRLIWTPAALQDVQRLYRFLAERNKDAGQRAIKAIRGGVKILADHPEAGRPVDEMAPEYREWLVDFGGSGYVALYRYDGKTALIVAVRHQMETFHSETFGGH
jgi:plasmid stabilization system protein ParE